MTLRTDYNFNTTMNTAYALGLSLLTVGSPAYTTLSAGLAAASSQGKEIFTININHNSTSSILELKNAYWDSYVTGIEAALASEGIFNREVAVSLNTSVVGTATLDFNFSF